MDTTDLLYGIEGVEVGAFGPGKPYSKSKSVIVKTLQASSYKARIGVQEAKDKEALDAIDPNR